MIETMKVGITGASGFIGSALRERLIQDGMPVIPIVRAPAGLAGERVVGEIDGSTDWSGVLEGVDVLVHLAARVHVMVDRATDPLAEFRRVNRDGTANLARQAAAQGIRRFVFVSSVKVNGESSEPDRPFRADDPPAPSDPYGVSKLEAEQALAEIAGETAMDYVIIRPPLVYGPGVGGNFRSIVRWIRRGLPLPLGAVSTNRRSLVSVDNLVDLIRASIARPRAAGQTFLVSDGHDLSTVALLRGIARAMDSKARLISVPQGMLRAAARLAGRTAAADRLLGNLQVDISKTCDVLDWRPPVSVEAGLRAAVGADR